MIYFTAMRLVQIFWLSLMMLSTTHVYAESTAAPVKASAQTKAPVKEAVTLASTSAAGQAVDTSTTAAQPAGQAQVLSSVSRAVGAPPSSSDSPAKELVSTSAAGVSSAGGSASSGSTQPELDLAALEDRLVETDAIGFFTKLELKSQIDELTEKFREFHAANAESENDKLNGLREEFDLLLLKVLTLLQDDDPTLHRDVAKARPQIWETFSDPELFAKL